MPKLGERTHPASGDTKGFAHRLPKPATGRTKAHTTTRRATTLQPKACKKACKANSYARYSLLPTRQRPRVLYILSHPQKAKSFCGTEGNLF